MMVVIRLLPLIFSTILLAAHVMRSYGLQSAMVVVLLLATLFIGSRWVLRFWQIVLAVGALMWVNTTIDIVQMRIAMQQPWLRLAIIMGAVIAFTIFSLLWLQNKKLRSFYQ